MTPTVPPSGPDPYVLNANAGRAGRATRGTIDAPSRVSSAALASLVSRLTPLDHGILALVRSLRLVSSEQIQRYTLGRGVGSTEARSFRGTLERLAAHRVLDRLPRAIGGSGGGGGSWIYCVGPVGRRVLASEGVDARRTRAPGARHVDHTLAVSEILVQLTEECRADQLELLMWAAEPDCWREYPSGFGSTRTLRPDLFAVVGAGEEAEDRWWIEVDRATESVPTLLGKCQRYLEYMRAEPDVHPRVLWIVPTDERAERLREVIQTLPQGARPVFSVCVYEDAVSLIAAEARL